MRYQLSFHDTDSFNDQPDLVFYGQAQPFVPRVGERVQRKNGSRTVKQVEYIYEGDTSIRVMITVGDESKPNQEFYP
jgi:hypothetical protein